PNTSILPLPLHDALPIFQICGIAYCRDHLSPDILATAVPKLPILVITPLVGLIVANWLSIVVDCLSVGRDAYSLPSGPKARSERSEEHTSELQSPDHLVC